MRSWVAATTLLGLVTLAAPARADPPRYDPSQPHAQRDALGILRDGDAYLVDVELPGDPFDADAPFAEIDAALAAFLEHPDMQPSVQFSCASMDTPGEARLTKALRSRNHAKALIALAALVHVHSPSTVEAQLAALARLRKARAPWKTTLEAIESRFDPEALAAAIGQDPPTDQPFGDAPALEWAIRAVGVRKQPGVLPRLATLCQSEHLYTSLAAERSIEDFTGPDADAALATCIEGWRYDAADRAFEALRDRNPALARTALLGMALPPKDDLDRYASALVDVADPSAVPRIVEVVAQLDNPSRAIGALESHAAPHHRVAIHALASRVSEPHRDRLTALAKRL